jgi:hypothetical protein
MGVRPASGGGGAFVAVLALLTAVAAAAAAALALMAPRRDARAEPRKDGEEQADDRDGS